MKEPVGLRPAASNYKIACLGCGQSVCNRITFRGVAAEERGAEMRMPFPYLSYFSSSKTHCFLCRACSLPMMCTRHLCCRRWHWNRAGRLDKVVSQWCRWRRKRRGREDSACGGHRGELFQLPLQSDNLFFQGMATLQCCCDFHHLRCRFRPPACGSMLPPTLITIKAEVPVHVAAVGVVEEMLHGEWPWREVCQQPGAGLWSEKWLEQKKLRMFAGMPGDIFLVCVPGSKGVTLKVSGAARAAAALALALANGQFMSRRNLGGGPPGRPPPGPPRHSLYDRP